MVRLNAPYVPTTPPAQKAHHTEMAEFKFTKAEAVFGPHGFDPATVPYNVYGTVDGKDVQVKFFADTGRLAIATTGADGKPQERAPTKSELKDLQAVFKPLCMGPNGDYTLLDVLIGIQAQLHPKADFTSFVPTGASQMDDTVIIGGKMKGGYNADIYYHPSTGEFGDYLYQAKNGDELSWTKKPDAAQQQELKSALTKYIRKTPDADVKIKALLDRLNQGYGSANAAAFQKFQGADPNVNVLATGERPAGTVPSGPLAAFVSQQSVNKG